MEGQVKNYRRFYAALHRMPGFGDEEERKAMLVETYTKGRTKHLSEMSQKEYTAMCQGMESAQDYVGQRKRQRSIALHLMQELDIDTGDWQRINDFCQNPRICGKPFALLGIPELEALQKKLRAIKRNGGLKPRGEERRVKSEESHQKQQLILMNYGNNDIKC